MYAFLADRTLARDSSGGMRPLGGPSPPSVSAVDAGAVRWLGCTDAARAVGCVLRVRSLARPVGPWLLQVRAHMAICIPICCLMHIRYAFVYAFLRAS